VPDAPPPPATQIRVDVRLFAAYREAAGTRRLEVSLPAGSTVAELMEALEPRVPTLRTTPGLIAVNHTYQPASTPLAEGDEVAFIPPVSGGR
jgi:molybdopterin synthase catalytic subunit